MPRIYATEWNRLKQEIEEKLNLKGQTVGYIARFLDDNYSEDISYAQLNRLWQDKYFEGKEYKDMLDKTINDLVKILGYDNWRAYKDYLNQEILGKQIICQETTNKEAVNKLNIDNSVNAFYNVDIDISRLHPNEEIIIGYTNKYAKLRYIDGFEFEVIESHNTHKEKGERFITPGFSAKVSGSGEVDIMLDDYGDGYFEYQTKEFGEVFDDNYFYL